MSFGEVSQLVLKNRISRRDPDGNPYESPEDIFERVDKALDGGGLYKDLMMSKRFMPNSPTLVNAGTPNGQLSACFVLPVEDSISAIFDSVKNAALIHKTGGGTGFSFSRLRPEGTVVESTGGVASGPVSFMRVFDRATEAIKQGGVRRGANMGVLNVHHPDIFDFIRSKSDGKELSNFNISVGITEKFMKALFDHENYYTWNTWYHDGKSRHLPSLDVWEAIIQMAHKTGDPGVLFLDRINKSGANPMINRTIEATNPCGEQPLYPYDSCNLGSINLAQYVNMATKDFMWNDLRRDVHIAVMFLNDVIDNNKYPLKEIEELAHGIRRIGLGVMGWADALMMMGITYGSNLSFDLAKEVMSFIQNEAWEKSMQMGKFPMWKESMHEVPVYNSTVTTIAPTGTISMIAECSSGIEPVFDFVYKRSHYLDPNNPSERYEFIDSNPVVYQYLEKYGTEERELILQDIADEGLFPKMWPEYFVRASDISVDKHIKMQAAFQKYTDNAVSKTINLPEDASLSDVERAYVLAYELGCLGVTIYRDGSKSEQVLSHTSKKEDKPIEIDITPQREKLPDVRDSVTHKVSIDGNEFYITAGKYPDGRIGEVFIIGSKTGSTTRGYLDTIGSLLSINLQQGISIDKLVEKFSGVKFEPSGFTSNPNIPTCTSLVDYVVRWIDSIQNGEPLVNKAKTMSGQLCPECDGHMFYAEGCSTCPSCGYSKCG